MWRRQTIMRHVTDVESAELVFMSDDQPLEMKQVYYMPREQFEAMGRPAIITLTTEEGDRLNEPETPQLLPG